MAKSKTAPTTQQAERNIYIYGNPDKSELGFPMPGDLTRYIGGEIFSNEKGHYRYTQGKNADVIVLSRDGLAYGYFDILEKVKPTDWDIKAYPGVRFVYIVRKATLYTRPVPLASLSISKIRFGRKITEAEFHQLEILSEGTQEIYNPKILTESALELERTLREVRLRLGQSDFRRELIAAYEARCAVTGCDVLEALEAAHIDPYSGPHSNKPSNGLLLRADIHTLFDLNLIGIDPATLTIAVRPTLEKSTYGDLDGKSLFLPSTVAARPNAEALAERWRDFSAK